MRGPCWQLAVEARGVELVKGVGHRVLTHRRLEVGGKLVQAVVEQKRPLDVWIHEVLWRGDSSKRIRSRWAPRSFLTSSGSRWSLDTFDPKNVPKKSKDAPTAEIHPSLSPLISSEPQWDVG